MKLIEKIKKQHYFHDVDTGDIFIFDGEKLKKVGNSKSGKPSSSENEDQKDEKPSKPDEEKSSEEKSKGKSDKSTEPENEGESSESTESGGDSKDSGKPENAGESSESNTSGESKGKEDSGNLTNSSDDESTGDESADGESTEENANGETENNAEEENNINSPKFDKYDEEELAKQDAEREEEIKKELEELGDMDPYSSEAESRLEEIADLLNDESIADALFDETDKKVRASRKEKRDQEKAAKKEAEKYEAKQGIDNFVLDLNKLIKTEIKKITKSDWSKYNKKADGTGLIKPGKSQRKNPSIPKLYVYFDQSGSWEYDDIEIGKQAISTLNTFVKNKKLIIELFYFGERLTTTPGYEANGPSWECFDKVAEHIKTNKPDNVVIMTDSDGDYYDFKTGINSMKPVTVPGGMFLLFRRGAVSKQVVRVFKGKKLTKIYKF